MARGCPVIAADATALPEVVGDAGLLVDPHDADAWAAAMARLLVDDAPARRAAAPPAWRGPPTFTWDRAAAALAAAYRQALAVTTPAAATGRARMRLVVICPHFAPDVAPTGEVMTSIVAELVARGHRLHVVTSLPWYQHHAIEPGGTGPLVRHEDGRGAGSPGSTRSPPTSATSRPGRWPSAASPRWPAWPA